MMIIVIITGLTGQRQTDELVFDQFPAFQSTPYRHVARGEKRC